MRTVLFVWARQQGLLIGVVGIAAVLGAAIALAAGGASTQALLGGGKAEGGVNTPVAVASSPRVTPTPAPLPPGQLSGELAVVVAADRVAVSDGKRIAVVDAAGVSWINAPNGASGIVLAARNPQRVVAGGDSIQYSDDAGQTWHAPRAKPPGQGPYGVLLVGPDDPDVWFFAHGSKLLRTRDAGISWRELTGLPDLASPKLLPGSGVDQQLLIDGTTVAVLDSNGQQISTRPGLPAPAKSAAADKGAVLASGKDGKVYASSSSGQSWTDAGAPVAGPLAGAGGARVWISDGGAQAGASGRIVAGDGSSSWVDATGLGDQAVIALGADRAGTTVYAYCSGGDVYRSTDAGANFKRFSTALRSSS